MRKSDYLKPDLDVISVSSIQETMLVPSVTLSAAITGENLSEQAFKRPNQTAATEVVDCPEVKDKRASQPHVDDILPPHPGYLATRVDVAKIGVEDDLQHRPG